MEGGYGVEKREPWVLRSALPSDTNNVTKIMQNYA